MNRRHMFRCFCLLVLCSLLVSAAGLCDGLAPDHYRNWYEVFVYSYQDSDGDGIGDLPGLLSRLDYIEDMGYNGIWLMPIMPSPSYHKYDVADYLSVDPVYGTVEDFCRLTEACHARNIEVIIDLPVNHTSYDHPWFQAACEAVRSGDLSNPMVDYYHFSDKQLGGYIALAGTEWYYEERFAGGGMPDLNLDNTVVRNEITKIMDFWLNTCGADGFRLDATTSYYTGDEAANIAFLAWMKQTCEALKPGSYLVGECWAGLNTISSYYASGIDSFFLFPASQAEGWIASDVRARSKGAEKYAKHIEQMQAAVGDGIAAPFIGNHDTGRAVGVLQARSAPERAKFAEGVLNMMGGATFTYYGEQIGMVGAATDPDKRLGMYWNAEDISSPPPGTTKIEYAYPCVDEQLSDPGSLLNYCKAVNHLKLKVPAIARGRNKTIMANNTVCLMERTWQDDVCYIAINFDAKKAAEIQVPEKDAALAGELLTGTDAVTVSPAESVSTVVLPPLSIAVLTK